jgi:hypothetical protein
MKMGIMKVNIHEPESESYVTTEGQSASLSRDKADCY